MHPADALSAAKPFTAAGWPDLVEYGHQLLPVLDEFWEAWDRFCRDLGYERQGARYRIIASNNEQLAIFCHAGVILSLLSHLLHIPPPLVYSHFGCDPSSVSILETDEKDGWATFRLVVLNDMSHAPGLRQSPREHTRYGF
jgi:broad specificity phosphatase PhoE